MHPINWTIIIMVAVISFVSSALVGVAVYWIDKNANRHDKKH